MNFTTSFLKSHLTTTKRLFKWTEKLIFKQRLSFKYSDMTIYTSQRNMLNFFHNLIQPGQFSIIHTNINSIVKKSNMGKSALKLLSTPNAGGSSIYSEALSIEVLSRLLGVHLFKTETELIYKFPNLYQNGGSGPMMDYACHYMTSNHDLLTLGVSVTRAMSYNRNYTKEDASYLIEKKLNNIIKSNQSISNTKFDRNILHIWTESGKNASVVRRVCKKVLKKNNQQFKDTIVLVTTVNNDLVFFNNNKHLSSTL